MVINTYVSLKLSKLVSLNMKSEYNLKNVK